MANKVEINPTGASWEDITSLVQYNERVIINRGMSSEGSKTQTSSMNFTVDNTTGDFSPNNPLGQWYGSLKRNCPIRLSVARPTTYLRQPKPGVTTYASVTDTAALDITGDIDVRFEAKLDTWWTDDTGGLEPVGKFITATDNRSWAIFIRNGGYIRWEWSTDGTAGTVSAATSQITIPARYGRHLAIRVTMDVDNGASGNTVRFYAAPTIDGTWEQLGGDVVSAGTTSIFASTAALRIGNGTDVGFLPASGEIYKFQLLDGIGGTAVADVDFTVQTVGATSFVDDAGLTWNLSAGGVAISDRDYRFWGELADLAPDADSTSTKRTASVTANGVLRRLMQGAPALHSALYRGITALTNLRGYWPCEDLTDGESLASAFEGAQAGTFVGTPNLGTYDGFAASDNILTVGTSKLTFNVPSYTDTNYAQVRFLAGIPAMGMTNNDRIVSIYTNGSLARVDLRWTTNGGFEWNGYDADGTLTWAASAIWAFGAVGVDWRISIELAQDGADVDVNVYALAPGGIAGGGNETFVAATLGRITKVIFNPSRNCAEDMAIGHVTIEDTPSTLSDLEDQFNAWRGEKAADRFRRLCKEEGLTYVVIDDGRSEEMGAQRVDTLVNLLRECEDADEALLYEPRDGDYQLGFRSRTSMGGHDAALTYDYSLFHLSEQMRPTYDDSVSANDVTVTRAFGGSVNVNDAASIAAIGRYDMSVTRSLYSDNQIQDSAGWILNLGTVDEARYPKIAVNLARAPFVASDSLTSNTLLLELGDRIDVQEVAEWISYDVVRMRIVGTTEIVDQFEHKLTFQCTPYEPWNIAVYDSAHSRYDTSASELSTSLESTRTVFAGAGTRSYTDIDVTGDIDIRVKCSLDDWTPAQRTTLVAKYLGTGNQRAVRLQVTGTPDGTAGLLRLYWSNNGTASLLASSTSATGFTDGAVKWIRATLDVDNGAAGCDVKFYTSDDGANWTQLGSTVTQGFTTSIYNATTLWQLGGSDGAALLYPLSGAIHRVIVLDGIDGSAIALPIDPEDWTDGYSGAATGGTTVEDVTSSVFAVATTDGPIWTTDDAEFPFDVKIGGEQITVTDIAGATSPQTFTTTRSVNGVVKSHDAASSVGLYHPCYYDM